MKIGAQEIFSTERTKKQFVTTKFLFIGLPVIPVKSYFVYDKTIEIGSFPIPLNKKNIIKNYLSAYLLIFSFFLVLFNYFLNDNFILHGYYYHFSHLNLSLSIIEKIITICVVFLTLYFIFLYGKITKKEKEERILIQKCDFWKTALPGKNLIPILGKFYNKEEQKILLNQLILLFISTKTKLNDKENEKHKPIGTQTIIDSFNINIEDYIISENYKKENEKTVALLFVIISLKKRLGSTKDIKRYYKIIKDYLTEFTKPNNVNRYINTQKNKS